MDARNAMNFGLFGKNAIIYMMGNIGLRATSFFLIPIYTYSLTVSEYGLLATLLLTVQIMIMFMGLGTETGFIRFATEYEKKNLAGQLLGSSILINVLGGVAVSGISIGILLPFSHKILHTDQVFALIVMACAAAMTQSLFLLMLSYYRAKNDGKMFVLMSVSAAVMMIIANFIFLYILDHGIRGALWAQIISYGTLYVFLSLLVFSRIRVGYSMPLLKRLLKFNLPLVFAMSGFMITNGSAVYFLSYFVSLEEVAIYSLGFKMAEISSMVLILPFQLAYEPFVYSNINKPGIRDEIARLLTYLMIAFAFVALGIVFISRGLLSVIAPPEYFLAYTTIFLILPGIAFRGVRYVGESLLHIRNRTYVTGLIDAIITILSVLLNFLLIPKWGLYGAIYVFNIRLISIALLLMIFGMRSFPVPLEYKRLAAGGLLLTFFLTSVFFLRETGIAIYCSVIPLIGLTGIVLLSLGGFFYSQEKTFIKDIILQIRKRSNNIRLLREFFQQS
jgi:O-antigen/teichoic acid export membrane protein